MAWDLSRRVFLRGAGLAALGVAAAPSSLLVRAAEAAEAARILGVAHRESLGLPDAQLQPTVEARDAVIAALRRLRPRVVILQHWEQRHPDHAAASRLVYDAAFVAGLKAYRPELGPAFRPQKLVYSVTMTEAQEAPPSFVVDISDVFETKMRAVAAFASQFTPGPGEQGPLHLDRYREAIELSARRHGQRIGVRYGEGFVLREPVSLTGVGDLLGSSF